MRNWKKYLGAYVVMFFLASGWSYNHTDPKMTFKCADPAGGPVYCDRHFTAFWAGVFWPLDLGWKVAIFATRWP